MKNIVLIGMPASGKSTIGVILAKTLGVGFVDTDLIIQQRQQKLLQDIIDSDGLDFFIKAEEEAILSVENKNCVISTGGSAVFSQKGMAFLKQNGIVIFIDVPIEEIKRRLDNIKTRGIAADKNQTLDEIYEERLPYYKRYSDIIFNVNNGSVEDSIEKLKKLLKIS